MVGSMPKVANRQTEKTHRKGVRGARKGVRGADMNKQISLFPELDTASDIKKNIKSRWENGFQRWSNTHMLDDDDPTGACGYGSMCDYCEDNSYSRPCVRALNIMLRETGESIDYEHMSFEDVWEGARA